MLESRQGPAVAVLALVAIAIVAIWLLRGDAHAVEPAPRAPADVTTNAAPATGALVAAAPVADREAVEPSQRRPGWVDDRAHVRGRCVDERGQPLAGCTATFDAWGGNATRMALQGDVPWQDPEPIVTGDDGVFDFAFEPPSGMQFALDVQGEGRVPRTGRWSRIERGQILDLGDIELPTGYEVRGRVVDERGAPVSRVAVALEDLPLPLTEGMAANDVRYGSSNENGDFVVRVPIPPGTWPIDVSSRGIRLVRPNQVTVTESGSEPLVVIVRRMPSISGIVVDERGAPVQGVTVEADLNRSGRMAAGRSKKDGTFVIHAVDAEPQPVRLRISNPGPCEPPPPDERFYDWGTRDVRIDMRRALALELEVVERESRAPVTRYAVQCYSASARSSRERNLRLSGTHEHGRVTVDRVWRGKNYLRIVPLDASLACSEPIEFEVPDGGAPPMRVEVERLTPGTVQVTNPDGTPIAGSKIELVRKGTRSFTADTWLAERGSTNSWSTNASSRAHELVSRATTDATGSAVVFVPPDQTSLLVRASGPHRPVIVDPAQFPTGQPLVIVLPPAGGIAGQVLFAELDPTHLRVSCHRIDSVPDGEPSVQVQVDSEGAFAIPHIAPGNYRLEISHHHRYRRSHGSSGAGVDLDVQIPRIEVRADQQSSAEIDVRAIAPATVRGRVFVNGAPPTAARIDFRRGAGATFGQFAVAADGTFEAPGLIPGTYRAAVIVGDFVAGPGLRIQGAEEFELTSGQDYAREFHFTRRRLVVTLLQADGVTPAALLPCYCRSESGGSRKQTDANGRLVFDPAPDAEIEILPQGSKTRLVAAIPANQNEHEVKLTLPANVTGKSGR